MLHRRSLLAFTAVLAAAGADAQPAGRLPDAPDAQTVVDLYPEIRAEGVADRAVGRPVGDGFDGGAVVVTAGEMEEALGELVREYRRTGRAGVLRQSAMWVFPFGHTQPVLACAPLRASVVELEPGETVLDVVAGDTERFAVEQAASGPGGRTPLVVVKPLAYDVTTNLVVSTDRRVYHITLDSPPRPAEEAPRGRGRNRSSEGRSSRSESLNPQARYARHVRFYYPDDGAPGTSGTRPLSSATSSTAPTLGDGVSLDDLSFGYVWAGDRGLHAAVERVFDDGVHTYVQLSGRSQGEAPVLFALGPDGAREVVNYAYRAGPSGAGTYVADRVLDRAELVLGETVRRGPFGLLGRRQVERFVRIVRTPASASSRP